MLLPSPCPAPVLLQAGGLIALLDVAAAPRTTLKVLAPTTTALLNLSSYLPIMVSSPLEELLR
jgi:hypothetical protein